MECKRCKKKFHKKRHLPWIRTPNLNLKTYAYLEIQSQDICPCIKVYIQILLSTQSLMRVKVGVRLSWFLEVQLLASPWLGSIAMMGVVRADPLAPLNRRKYPWATFGLNCLTTAATVWWLQVLLDIIDCWTSPVVWCHLVTNAEHHRFFCGQYPAEAVWLHLKELKCNTQLPDGR